VLCRSAFARGDHRFASFARVLPVQELTDIVEKICADREATKDQEKRGAVILTKWIERSKLQPWVRARALQALPKCDVDSAKYASKLKIDNDEHGEVKRAATASRAKRRGPSRT